MSSQQNQAISVAECEQYRDRFEAGDSVGQIAEQFDRGRTTVRRHVHDRCSHAVEDGGWGGTDETDCPLCGDTIIQQNLATHLPKCPARGGAEAAATNRGESA